MAAIEFSGVGKVYPDGTRAVTDLNLRVDDGEFMVLVGPSGCGKTTALRMVAGLEEITEGELRIGGTVMNTVDPRKRDVAVVFQNYALYPHMTVFENIAFPLRSRRLAKNEIRTRVERTAGLLSLTEQLHRRPRHLSGGQRQRVAMGRAIVREPQAFLMDEPLSNLDAKLRVQTRGEIASLQRELGVTTIYVTHDQVEALTMGTRIAVMRKGVLQQQGPPQQLYDHPANLFVATFIGSPAMNLFRARLESNGGGLEALIGEQRLPVPAARASAGLGAYVGREVALGIRPEHLQDPAFGMGELPRVRGQVRLIEALGSERWVHVEVPGEPIVTDEIIEIAADVDASAVQSLRAEESGHHIPVIARFDAKSTAAIGAEIEVGVDCEHLHLFDIDRGNAIV